MHDDLFKNVLYIQLSKELIPYKLCTYHIITQIKAK
jgi:hypothetical protein